MSRPMRAFTGALALALALALVMASAGCATVSPWERGRLARPCMQSDRPGALDAFDEHVRGVREGGSRASSAGGGGCGCN